MATLTPPREHLSTINQRRRRLGLDRQDEVRQGIDIVMTDPADEHRDLVGGPTYAPKSRFDRDPAVRVRPGVNISSDRDRWAHEDRRPDIALFLPGSSASDRETQGSGGPDLAVEVVRPSDGAA